MVRWILTALLVIGGVLLQGLVPGAALLGQVRLPLLLGLVLYMALNRTWGEMMAVAVVAGLGQDMLSRIPLGYTAVLFAVCALVAYRFRPVVVSDSPLTAACFGAPSAVGVTALLWLLLLREGLVGISVGAGLLRLGGAGLLGVVTVPLVFFVCSRLYEAIGETLSPEESDGFE
jgi:rod shape-determining protein MreD